VGARSTVVVEGVGGGGSDVRRVGGVVRRRVGGAAVLVGRRVVALVRVLARRLQRALRRVHLVGGGAELRRRRVGVLPHRVVQVARVVAVLRVAGCKTTFHQLFESQKRNSFTFSAGFDLIGV